MMEDLCELKPTIFGSFPMFFNKLYKRIHEKIATQDSSAKSLFDNAVKAKVTNLIASGTLTHPAYDRLIFNKIK